MTLRCKVKRLKERGEVKKPSYLKGSKKYTAVIECEVYGKNQTEVKKSLRETNIQVS